MRPSPDDPGLRSSSIKATKLRRVATLCAIAILKRFRKRYGDLLFLNNSICVKYGTRVDLAEAATLDYVGRHTSIPAPRVHCAFDHDGKTYIVMKKLPGHMLAHKWHERSKESQQRILKQLKDMIDQLRALPSPFGDAVANVDGGSLTDPRLPGLDIVYPIPTSSRFGPFDNTRDFHRWLRRPVLEVPDKCSSKTADMINEQEKSDWGSPVLTHGDLSSLNILVDGDKVTGIVDWEISGWYPYYWEYTTAMQGTPRNLFWRDFIDSFLTPYPTELKMELARQEYFGGP